MAAKHDHVAAPGPKRILAIDGGGVRGIVAIQFLKEIEKTLAARHGRGDDFRLCDYFDLIIGTSTGAILAAGLSIGRSAGELEKQYLDMAPRVFRPGAWTLWGLGVFIAGAVLVLESGPHTAATQTILWGALGAIGLLFPLYGALWSARFKGRVLSRILEKELDGLTLGDERLRTGLAIVTKRVDTDSAWVLTNNPSSHWWETHEGPDGKTVLGNRYYKLASIVRASTAAPYYFRPERIAIGRRVDGRSASRDRGTFLDGGVTTHNNPSLMALRLALFDAHGLHWKAGPGDLLIVSVGTGSWRKDEGSTAASWQPAAWQAVSALTGMVAESERQVLIMMQWLSRVIRPQFINAELGDMTGEAHRPHQLCSFLRYDVTLETAEISALLGRAVSEGAVKDLRDMTNAAMMDDLSVVGAKAAGVQVRSADFPIAFDRGT